MGSFLLPDHPVVPAADRREVGFGVVAALFGIGHRVVHGAALLVSVAALGGVQLHGSISMFRISHTRSFECVGFPMISSEMA